MRCSRRRESYSRERWPHRALYTTTMRTQTERQQEDQMTEAVCFTRCDDLRRCFGVCLYVAPKIPFAILVFAFYTSKPPFVRAAFVSLQLQLGCTLSRVREVRYIRDCMECVVLEIAFCRVESRLMFILECSTRICIDGNVCGLVLLGKKI